MANPRKFSEKIALHHQKQAEETAAFEKIMREVSDATQKVCRLFTQAVTSWPSNVPADVNNNHFYTLIAPKPLREHILINSITKIHLFCIQFVIVIVKMI